MSNRISIWGKGLPPARDDKKVTDIMIENGYAVAYFGGSKDEIDMKHMANREKLLRESAVNKADYDAAVAKMK